MISFWRVVFTFSIALHHLGNAYSIPTFWMIGVEFFFIVSGWLLAAKADNSDLSAFEYTIHRIKRLYPLYLSALVICVICMRFSFLWNIQNQFSIESVWQWFTVYGYKEALLIHFWPWENDWWNIANIPTWYISIMLICGLILFSLYKNHKAILCQIIIPISIVMFYSISYKFYRNFTEDEYIYGVISLKMFRGFTEMGIGVLLYELNKKKAGFLKKNIFINVIGFICLALVWFFSYSYGEQYNYIYVILISIGIFCSFNTEIKYGKRIIAMLSSLSYSIYLNHNVIRLYLMPRLFNTLDIWSAILYVVLVIVFACVMQLTTKGLLICIQRCYGRYIRRVQET